ncbi:MAG: AAA family ATPase [Burkholderiales bacterium]
MNGTVMRQEASTSRRRQHLTLLFTDMRGSTVLGRKLEVELFDDVLSDLRRIWRSAADRHGGFVVRMQGDGALIAFGYPNPTEDGGRRAVEAALDIHAAARDIAGRHLVPRGSLSVRSGIHAGIALLSEGDLERGRIDIAGDVPNMAAHLQQGAPDDGILASLDALGPDSTAFETEPCVFENDLKVMRILSRREHAARTRAPLVGRGATMEALRAFLKPQPISSAARCVVVQGGPGFGKTRVLDEVGSWDLEGWTLLRGRCESQANAELLQPFVQILRNSQLPTDTASAPRHLIALCSSGPTLVLVDDWQWADDASRRLLLQLLDECPSLHVLLSARQRDDGSAWIADAPHVLLEPFDANETEQAVRRLLPQVDPFLAAQIHADSGGVPLYIEELCHAAVASSLAPQIGGRPKTTGWLGALVASRLAHLAESDAQIVRISAIIGNVVPLALLAEVCAGLPGQAVLRRLSEADFLFQDEAQGLLRFKHGVTRDAVYQSIGLYERTEWHRVVAAALLAQHREENQASDVAEAIAFHARGAGDWDRAATFAERAGDKASAAFALDAAHYHYRVALDALDHMARRGDVVDRRWCDIVAKLGGVCVFDPLSLRDGLADFERAVAVAERLPDPALASRALYWLGYLLYAVGRFRDAAVQTRAALESARLTGNARLSAQSEATLGQVFAGGCEYRSALAMLNRALGYRKTGTRPGGGSGIGWAFTLACKGSVLADQGDFGAAHVAFDEALSLLGDRRHPTSTSTQNWVAISLIWQGRWNEAIDLVSQSARIAVGTRALLLLSISRCIHGYARFCQGDAEGIQLLRQGVGWLATRHCDFYASLFNGWLAEAAFAAGRFEEMRSAAIVVLRRRRDGETLGEAVAYRTLALHAAGERRQASARRWLARAEASAQRRESRREHALNLLARARLAQLVGDDAASEAATASASDLLLELGVVYLPPAFEPGFSTPALVN